MAYIKAAIAVLTLTLFTCVGLNLTASAVSAKPQPKRQTGHTALHNYVYGKGPWHNPNCTGSHCPTAYRPAFMEWDSVQNRWELRVTCQDEHVNCDDEGA